MHRRYHGHYYAKAQNLRPAMRAAYDRALQQCDAALALPPMVARNEDPKETAFTVSVDYRHGTTTGISAHDRALTIRKLADPAARARDFHRPGHVFPLRYRRGGVLARRGHTEAAVDLARLCGCAPPSNCRGRMTRRMCGWLNRVMRRSMRIWNMEIAVMFLVMSLRFHIHPLLQQVILLMCVLRPSSHSFLL